MSTSKHITTEVLFIGYGLYKEPSTKLRRFQYKECYSLCQSRNISMRNYPCIPSSLVNSIHNSEFFYDYMINFIIWYNFRTVL